MGTTDWLRTQIHSWDKEVEPSREGMDQGDLGKPRRKEGWEDKGRLRKWVLWSLWRGAHSYRWQKRSNIRRENTAWSERCQVFLSGNDHPVGAFLILGAWPCVFPIIYSTTCIPGETRERSLPYCYSTLIKNNYEVYAEQKSFSDIFFPGKILKS